MDGREPESFSEWMGFISQQWRLPKGVDKVRKAGICQILSSYGGLENGKVIIWVSDQTVATNCVCSADKIGNLRRLAIKHGFLKPTGEFKFGVPVMIRWIPDNPVQEPVKAKPEVSQPKAAEVAQPEVAKPRAEGHDDVLLWPTGCKTCYPKANNAQRELSFGKQYSVFLDKLKADHYGALGKEIPADPWASTSTS